VVCCRPGGTATRYRCAELVDMSSTTTCVLSFLLADGEFRIRFPCILDYQTWAYEGPARTGRWSYDCAV
jgi:hypothetical protein